MEESAQHGAGDVETIARNPRLWRALLFAHTADQAGTCHTCVGVRWPCRTRKLAELAERRYNNTRP